MAVPCADKNCKSGTHMQGMVLPLWGTSWHNFYTLFTIPDWHSGFVNVMTYILIIMHKPHFKCFPGHSGQPFWHASTKWCSIWQHSITNSSKNLWELAIHFMQICTLCSISGFRSFEFLEIIFWIIQIVQCKKSLKKKIHTQKNI